ncbi:MAG: hypothetical protein AAB368_12180, partial [bacterium]
ADEAGTVAGLVGWLPLAERFADTAPGPGLGLLSSALTREAFDRRQFTTYWEARDALRAEPGLRGVIELGDSRFYRLPGRFLTGWMLGRTPAWTLAADSPSAERVRVRLRQLDCRHLLDNFVGEEFPQRCAEAYPWTARALRVWTDFVGRHLEVAVLPWHVDHEHGGFCLYRLRPAPLAYPPPHLPYLPGGGSRFNAVTSNGWRGDSGGWIAAALTLLVRLPQVDQVRNLVAAGYRQQGRMDLVYAYHLPGIEHGQIDDNNWWETAVAAAALGRFDEAERLAARALDLSPYLADEVARLRADIARLRRAR